MGGFHGNPLLVHKLWRHKGHWHPRIQHSNLGDWVELGLVCRHRRYLHRPVFWRVSCVVDARQHGRFVLPELAALGAWAYKRNVRRCHAPTRVSRAACGGCARALGAPAVRIHR